MRKISFTRSLAFTLALAPLLAPQAHAAEGLSLPRDGDNQVSSVHQWVGLVELSVTYSSPDVHAPDGTDRRGKIWGPGNLVPYGYHTEGFGTCGAKCPWRGGADVNTVFRTSHDVLVEGKKLAAGAYGMHFLPGENEWTVIFSNDSTSWGSFFYEESKDALRVVAKPTKAAYREFLTYEFTDRQRDKATLELAWEELALPIHIAVPNVDEISVEKIAQELNSSPGFDWRNWQQAAEFLLQKNLRLDLAETWARAAVEGRTFVSQENFRTLATLSRAQAANKKPEAQATLLRALNHATAMPTDIHQVGRSFQAEGNFPKALEVFELNAKRFPNQWPVNVGLMRGYAGVGQTAKALLYAKKALAQAPDEQNKQNLTRLIGRLEKGEDINR
jgi:hypothetical protein